MDATHNCILNICFVEAKITSILFLKTCFSFILHAKIYLIVVSIKYIFLKLIFLKSQLKVFFLNLIF
jgi:hypothetical protein